jgi:hypothetical protein
VAQFRRKHTASTVLEQDRFGWKHFNPVATSRPKRESCSMHGLESSRTALGESMVDARLGPFATERCVPRRYPRMQPENTKPKPFSQFQSWLLMGTIFAIAAVAIWLPVLAG